MKRYVVLGWNDESYVHSMFARMEDMLNAVLTNRFRRCEARRLVPYLWLTTIRPAPCSGFQDHDCLFQFLKLNPIHALDHCAECALQLDLLQSFQPRQAKRADPILNLSPQLKNFTNLITVTYILQEGIDTSRILPSFCLHLFFRFFI